MTTWIICRPADDFYIREYLASRSQALLPVEENHIARSIRPGDAVYILSTIAGKPEMLLAKGFIAGPARLMADDAPLLSKVPIEESFSFRVPVRLTDVRVEQNYIDGRDLGFLGVVFKTSGKHRLLTIPDNLTAILDALWEQTPYL